MALLAGILTIFIAINHVYAQCDLDDLTASWDAIFSSSSDSFDNTDIDIAHAINTGTNIYEATVNVTSKYLTRATYSVYESFYEDVTSDGLLGFTYVLDTNPFMNEGRLLEKANPCENRLEASFDGKDFLTDFWEYTMNPNDSSQFPSDDYLEYGDQNVWSLSLASDAPGYCDLIEWVSVFSFNQLINNCTGVDSDGNIVPSYTLTETDNSISFEITFYLTAVSPNPLTLQQCKNMQNETVDCGQYLVNTLISKPLIITFTKVTGVINDNNGITIDLFSSVVVGTSFVESSDAGDNNGTFRVTVITIVPSFMALDVNTADLITPTKYQLEMDNVPGFIKDEIAIEEITDGYTDANCLILNEYRCFQKFDIIIELNECPSDSGLDFDGSYRFSADFVCIDDNPACDDYESDEPTEITLDAVDIDYTELCDASVYNIEWDGTLVFYTDSSYTVETDDIANATYSFGDTVYARVSVADDIDNYEIFGMSIETCFVCTADISDDGQISSCTEDSSVDSSLFYEMPDDGLEYMPINSNISDTVEDFSFELPLLADDVFFVDCVVQLELLTNKLARRRNRRLLQDEGIDLVGNVYVRAVGGGRIKNPSTNGDDNNPNLGSSDSNDNGNGNNGGVIDSSDDGTVGGPNGNNKDKDNESEDDTFVIILIVGLFVIVGLVVLIGWLLYKNGFFGGSNEMGKTMKNDNVEMAMDIVGHNNNNNNSTNKSNNRRNKHQVLPSNDFGATFVDK